MKRRTILFSIILLLVIVAAGVILPTRNTLSDNPGVWSSGSLDSFAIDRASASIPSGAITLLSVTESENGTGLDARPVDPATLSELPDYAPINFGHHYTYAVSPDRKTLALIIWPSGSNIGGVLHLVDLDAWTDTLTDLDMDVFVGDLTFGADGKTLYWTMPTAQDATHGIPYGYQLHRYDLESRQLSAIVQFPLSFTPWGQQIIQLSAGNIAIFVVPTDSNNLAEDAPHVLIVDVVKNRITADIRLDGVKAWQFFEKERVETCLGQERVGQYVIYRPGLAWNLEDNLLYIVHAQDEQVTIVDLVKGAVTQQTEIRPHHSVLGRLFEALVPVVEAKGGPEAEARAVLNREGERLYTFRQTTECGALIATNLQVVATGNMRAIGHLDERLTDFALTPDGKSLLVTRGETVNTYGFEMMVTRDIYILDAETLQERAHVRVDQVDQLWFDGFSPDGRYAYVRGSSARWVEGSGWRDWRTTWQLLDLSTYRLIPAGETGGSYAVLLHLFP